MKKRVACLLVLAILCALCLSACEVPPEVAVVQAYTRTALLTSYDAQMDMKVSVKIPDLNYHGTVPVRIDLKAEDALSKNPKLSVTPYLRELGEMRAQTTIYSDGRYFYIPNVYGSGGSKVALEDLDDEYEGADEYDDLISDLLTSLPRDILTNSTILAEDGLITVRTALSEEQLQELYGDIVEDMTEAAGEDLEFEEITVEDAEVSMVIENEYVQSYRLTFTLAATVKRGSRSYDMTIASSVGLSLNNPGEAVTVDFPKNYAEYKLKEN